MKLNEELANWLADLREQWSGKVEMADLREQWSGKVEKPLEDYTTFLCYFLGTSTTFCSLAFFLVYVPKQGTIATNIPDKLTSDWPILFAVSLALAAMIALLLSWPRRSYTPARMYLGGLAFTALVCLIVTNVAGQLAKQLLL